MEANPEQRSVLSIECGINFNSILNQLKYFHVCSGALLPDIFHDLLEGVFPFEIKLLSITWFAMSNFLDDLNSAVENIDPSHLDALDWPTPISHQTLFCDQI